MDPIIAFLLGSAVTLIVYAIILKVAVNRLTENLEAATEHEENKAKVTFSRIEDLNRELNNHIKAASNGKTYLDSRIEPLTRQLSELENRQEHTGRIAFLLLDHLNLAHEVQPAQDRLVKRAKERSA
jgi:hypothetical protein